MRSKGVLIAKVQKKEIKRQWHTKEFRSSAVKMVLEEGIEAKDVASRLGIDLMALRRWTNKEQQTKSSKDQESMKDLLQVNRKLEEENKRLKMEREILKKAMAYLVPSQS